MVLMDEIPLADIEGTLTDLGTVRAMLAAMSDENGDGVVETPVSTIDDMLARIDAMMTPTMELMGKIGALNDIMTELDDIMGQIRDTLQGLDAEHGNDGVP